MESESGTTQAGNPLPVLFSPEFVSTEKSERNLSPKFIEQVNDVFIHANEDLVAFRTHITDEAICVMQRKLFLNAVNNQVEDEEINVILEFADNVNGIRKQVEKNDGSVT